MKILVTILTVLFLMFTAETCDDGNKTRKVYDAEQRHTVANQQQLVNVQPPVSLNWSLEREQVNKRTLLWNDPNKVSYIYLINWGKVMAFYVIKGKVSSVNSQVTNTMQIVNHTSSSESGYVLPSPAEDGSYGTNGDGIFFFTTDGTYVEWKGDYMLSDKPLKMTTQPELIREIK